MLSAPLAHQAADAAGLWARWNADPALLASLALAAFAYARGARRSGSPAAGWFAGALAVTGVALLSPLDALAAELASAHMVQHVLLVLVAAPLLARAEPVRTMVRGVPLPLRRRAARLAARLPLRPERLRALRHPVALWGLHVATLWVWHSSALYDAAVRVPALHALEHAAFLGTAALFWSVVLTRRGARAVSPGLALLLVFGAAMASVLLSLLLTFAPAPWYDSYAATTTRWGLGHLADQQLAGAIMWVPAGLLYTGVALALLAGWLRAVERGERAAGELTPSSRAPGPRTS